jgi:hypothetical protein
MNRQPRIDEIPLISLACVLNGRSMRVSFLEAWRMLHRSHYGWLLPLDWYRWNVDGHPGEAYVYGVVKPAPRRLLWLIHMRGRRATTPRDLETLEEHDRIITSVTFYGRAARACKLFGDLPVPLRPFMHGEDVDDRGRRQCAYRMRADRDAFVIIGLENPCAPSTEHASGAVAGPVDWHLLLEPPPSEGVDAA